MSTQRAPDAGAHGAAIGAAGRSAVVAADPSSIWYADEAAELETESAAD
jgi:hypothetical protein